MVCGCEQRNVTMSDVEMLSDGAVRKLLYFATDQEVYGQIPFEDEDKVKNPPLNVDLDNMHDVDAVHDLKVWARKVIEARIRVRKGNSRASVSDAEVYNFPGT